MTVLAADLGGTKLAVAAFSPRGVLLRRRTVPLAGRAGEDVASLLVEQLTQLASDLPPGVPAPHAAGLCVPGIYHADRGTVWAPNIGEWDEFPLREWLAHDLRDLHVEIGGDRAAYILGETWSGAAAGARDAIFLAVGTGIGAGILVDGRVLRGHADISGAIGWMAIERPFAAKWKDCGCFEYQASGPGLARVARELSGRDMTAADIFAAYDSGDGIATRVIENAIECWGMAAANLVSLFNPEMIVFGGGVFGPATRFISRIHEAARRWAQPIAMREVRFVASTLGADAGLYGAARLALGGEAARA